MTPHRTTRSRRYVTIGDSSTEGFNAPDGTGGYRGWGNRLAERIATRQGSLLYANLTIRGRSTRQVRKQQLGRALAMRLDLVTLFSGANTKARVARKRRAAKDLRSRAVLEFLHANI